METRQIQRALLDQWGNVSIEMKIKDRKMDVGETMTFVYDYSRDWLRKVKLIEKL